jgi:hypothetical protein
MTATCGTRIGFAAVEQVYLIRPVVLKWAMVQTRLATDPPHQRPSEITIELITTRALRHPAIFRVGAVSRDRVTGLSHGHGHGHGHTVTDDLLSSTNSAGATDGAIGSHWRAREYYDERERSCFDHSDSMTVQCEGERSSLLLLFTNIHEELKRTYFDRIDSVTVITTALWPAV